MSNKYRRRLARKRQEKLRGFAELVISSYYFNIVSFSVLLCECVATLCCYSYQLCCYVSVLLCKCVGTLCCYSY